MGKFEQIAGNKDVVITENIKKSLINTSDNISITLPKSDNANENSILIIENKNKNNINTKWLNINEIENICNITHIKKENEILKEKIEKLENKNKDNINRINKLENMGLKNKDIFCDEKKTNEMITNKFNLLNNFTDTKLNKIKDEIINKTKNNNDLNKITEKQDKKIKDIEKKIKDINNIDTLKFIINDIIKLPLDNLHNKIDYIEETVNDIIKKK